MSVSAFILLTNFLEHGHPGRGKDKPFSLNGLARNQERSSLAGFLTDYGKGTSCICNAEPRISKSSACNKKNKLRTYVQIESSQSSILANGLSNAVEYTIDNLAYSRATTKGTKSKSKNSPANTKEYTVDKLASLRATKGTKSRSKIALRLLGSTLLKLLASSIAIARDRGAEARKAL